MTAQIIGVVDVFDAVTTLRPYQKNRPTAEALDLLREQVHRVAGPLFAVLVCTDPDFVGTSAAGRGLAVLWAMEDGVTAGPITILSGRYQE